MVDRAILPYMIQAIMGQTGSNSPVSQYGDEVTALADKSIFDLQNEIDKDQAFRSPFEDLGAIGSKTDFSVYGGVGKGAREKGQMYNLIAGLLSGASSGLGEDLSRESRTEAKDKIVKALTSRDAEQLGEDSRMDPYKDKVKLFNERLGGLEANMKSKSDLAGKGLEAITNIQVDPAPTPKMNEYQQRMLDLREKEMGFKQNQSSEMVQLKQQVEENKRLKDMGFQPKEIVINRGGGEPSLRFDAETASSLVESGANFNDITDVASQVNNTDPTATPTADPIEQTIKRLKLTYDREGYPVSDTEIIPSPYASIGEFAKNLKDTGATPNEIKDYVATRVKQIDESEKMAHDDYKIIVKSLSKDDMANPKNSDAYRLLSTLKGSLSDLAKQQGENYTIGTLNTNLGDLANKIGLGQTSDIAKVNGLVGSLRQFWTGVSRVAGSGSQSDIEFKTALESFQSPNLSVGERLRQVDTILKTMERAQKAIDILGKAPSKAGYGNTLAYARGVLDPMSTTEGIGEIGGVTPTPTETPAPNQTPIPSYQDYLMLAKGR